MAPRINDPVTKYARAVVRGRVVAGKWVRLACQRHLDDLRAGRARGLRFDVQAANRAIGFFRFLKHSKGEWAGSRFELGAWQQFIVGSLFGWKRADGTRRFRLGFAEIARKNGKTTLSSGIGLYLLVADGEPGAEVYTAATKRDQARLTHGEAKRMVKGSPALRRRVNVYRDNLSVDETSSKYEPLGADADTQDGLNPSGNLIDELHAHKTRDLVDVLQTAMGARRQPLTFEITTAGYDFNTIWGEHHNYSQQVLEGTVEDDAWFAYIATLDEEDDWTDPKVWVKANPNLGVSVKVDELRQQIERAERLPAAQNAVKRLRLNLPTQQKDRWIDLTLWDENQPVDHPGGVDDMWLKGRKCYGMLDLATVSDLTAWVMVFPCQEDPEAVDILARFWCPEARLTNTENQYRAQYAAWRDQGWLTVTKGIATDYAFVRTQVLEDAERFQLQNMNIDRLFQAHQLAQELMDEGIEVIGFGMGFISMAAPMKHFERLLLGRKLHHLGNPVLRWNADNVVVKQDPAGNLKPDKAASEGKIDGIVGILGGLDRLMRHEEPQGAWKAV